MSKGTLLLLGILIIIISVIISSQIANYQFNRNVKQEVAKLFSNLENKSDVIKKEDLNTLPQSVKKWLEYSQVVGKEGIRTVRLKQQATMRLKPEDKRWMPTEAEQYFTVDKPGFIWKAKIKAAPFIPIVGRDKYHQGKGHMLIKILSLITVADSKGKEMDQGTLLRYLAETVWFPTAALNNYITWEEIDEHSAKATMSYGGVTASGVFTFNDKGEVVNFTADRYREINGKYEMTTWSVNVNEYKKLDGILIPTKGEAIWKLETGDFKWFEFHVTEIEYDKPNYY
ncbi:MAG: hypothetical protein FH758_12240 [Firmicutes bacterium]|nr:hypothetical protein [Bacillota bacterium]